MTAVSEPPTDPNGPPGAPLMLGLSMHGIKPWSVLRTDQRRWRQRRAYWDGRGLDDTAGRPGVSVFPASMVRARGAIASRFDPVLAEALLAWYAPPAGLVLDPFAGGPTRGIVAAETGRRYLGVDLLGDQVARNRRVAAEWGCDAACWETGDALDVLPGIAAGSVDYVLSCPPYWDLERYSDDPCDLSTMDLDDWTRAHARVIALAADALAVDRFASWVIGDKRDSAGRLAQLPRRTVEAFEAAGMTLVNDQVLHTASGGRHWTLGRNFRATRSATRVHQYVLTFVKGDRRRASAAVRGESLP